MLHLVFERALHQNALGPVDTFAVRELALRVLQFVTQGLQRFEACNRHVQNRLDALPH